MKLISFLNDKNVEQLGVIYKENIFSFTDINQQNMFDKNLPENMQIFLSDVDINLKNIKSIDFETLDLKNSKVAQILSPVPKPPSCRDAYAFRQHVETMRKNRGLDMLPEFDQFPVFYFTNHQAVYGPGDVIVHEDHLNALDYELELAIVIGKEGRNITKEKAMDHVLGLMIMNDLSARALQKEELKLSLGPAKGKDFANCFGPHLITLDELKSCSKETDQGTVFDLSMEAYVNGEKISQGNANTMRWTFNEIIERVSYGATLYPGDIIGSGTVGTGCLGEVNSTKALNDDSYKPLWLKDGDEIVLKIDKLGSLKNTIKLEPCTYSILKFLE